MFRQTHSTLSPTRSSSLRGLSLDRAHTLLLIGCLLQGALSQGWSATVPQKIEALSGSCITIPCSFTIAEEHKKDLNTKCNGVWIKENTEMIVFNSSRPSARGTITGDLTQNNCTTVLNNIPVAGSGRYYLIIQCGNDLTWNFKNMSVQIKVIASPPQPSLTPSSVSVTEGTSVRLTCSAAVFCPTLPPSMTWTPSLGDSEANTVPSKITTSVLKFTATPLHNGLNLSCTASYQQKAGTALSATTSLTLSVWYAPRKTSVSVSPRGPVLEGSSVTLTCSSDANPPVNSYTWYRVDEGDTPLVGSAKTLDIRRINKGQGTFFCVAENQLGKSQSVTSDFLSTNRCGNGLMPLVLILSVMVCLCVLTVGICVFKNNQLSVKLKESRSQGTTGDTYATLDLSAVAPVYDTLHTRQDNKSLENDLVETSEVVEDDSQAKFQ